MESYFSSGAAGDSDQPCESTARITLLREYGSSSVHTAVVTECSSGGMGLRVPTAMQAGDAVRIDLGDSMFLGEVVHSRRSPETERYSSWCVGVCFEQGIFGLGALERLLEAIGGRDQSSDTPTLPSRSGVQTAEALDE